jgi:hypothetical protein
MLWLHIAATVGANVSYGLPYGPLGAVVSAPARWRSAWSGQAAGLLRVNRRTVNRLEGRSVS